MEIRHILEWFMGTSLAILGSTDDVELIKKEQDKLLDQTESFIKQEILKVTQGYGKVLANKLSDNSFIYENTDDNGEWIGKCLEEIIFADLKSKVEADQ